MTDSKNLKPKLHTDNYVFVSCPTKVPKYTMASFCMVAEDEGITYIMTKVQAHKFGLDYTYEASRISLEVHSSLEAVGLTALIARVLTKASISCNVIAGYHHDHLFVPVNRAQEAMILLKSLST